MINTASQISQPASAGQGGVAASSKIGSAEFGSLFATLLGLTAPASDGGQAQQNPFLQQQQQNPLLQKTQASQTSNANIGANLAGLSFELQASAGKTPEIGDASPADNLVANLIDILGKLTEQAEAGGKIDPALIAQVTKAIDALSTLIGAPTAQATNAQIAPATPLADVADVLRPATAIAQSPLDNELADQIQALVSKVAERGADAAPKLAQVAQKLAIPLPELANKLQELAQQLSQASPQPANKPAPATATAVANAQLDPETVNTVNLLFGSKEVASRATDAPLPHGQNGKTANAPVSAQALQEPSLDVPKPDAASTRTDNQTATADAKPNHAAAGNARAGAAAASASSIVSATADNSAQSDPLLLAQSVNQPVAKADFAAVLKPMTAAYQTPTPQLNMPHIAFEMMRQVRDGASRFQIRLDPPEMGKIDVKMDMDGTGNIHARLTVERADTLELLQRDARALERALSQAGLDGARTNLEFSLKQNPFARQDGQMAGGSTGQDDLKFGENELDSDDPIANVPSTFIYRGTASPGGVNLLA